MKKLINRANFALVGLMVTMSSSFAVNGDAMCNLVEQMGGIFKTLRSLAFVGAAFIIAGWAWGFISGGKGVDIEDVRKKGTGLLVGFLILFTLGTIITVFLSYVDANDVCDFSSFDK